MWPIPERRDVANRPRPCNPPTLITGCEWPTKKRDDVSDLSFIEGPQDLEKRLRPCNPPTLIRGCEWPTEKRDDILDLESSIGQLKGRVSSTSFNSPPCYIATGLTHIFSRRPPNPLTQVT